MPQPKNLLTKNALWGSVALTAVCIGIYFTYFGEREEVFEKAAPIEKRADPAREKIEIIRQMPVEKSLAVGADQLIPGSEVITISANKETWIRVVDANNQLIVARLLRPQSFYRLNTEAGFRLTAGEAGALNIYLGEERLSVPSLSGEGLLENFPIDRRSLSENAIKPVSQEIPLQQPEGLEQPEVLSLEKKPEATLFSLQKEAISKSE